MPRPDTNLIPLGIPWCRKEDYDAFVAIFEDSNDLPTTWEKFIAPLEGAEKSFQDAGKIVRRVYINPQTFPSWCKGKGCRINAKAREKFAAEIAIKEQRNAGGDW